MSPEKVGICYVDCQCGRWHRVYPQGPKAQAPIYECGGKIRDLTPGLTVKVFDSEEEARKALAEKESK